MGLSVLHSANDDPAAYRIARRSKPVCSFYLESWGKYFPRNRYTVKNIDDVWQADLTAGKNISRLNDGVKYLNTTFSCEFVFKIRSFKKN